ERGELLAGRERRQPLALLALVAVVEDRRRAERRVRGHGDRERGVDPPELLDRQRVGQRVGPGAAVLLGEGDGEQAELGGLAQLVEREAGGAVELLGDRRDLALGELAHGVAEEAVLFGEIEVHTRDLTVRATVREVPRRGRMVIRWSGERWRL